MIEKVNIGVIGCGRISPQYLENLVRRFSFCLNTAALAGHCARGCREAGRGIWRGRACARSMTC